MAEQSVPDYSADTMGAATNTPGPRAAAFRPQTGPGWGVTGSGTPGQSGARGRVGGGPWANMARSNPNTTKLYGFGRRKKPIGS